MKISFIGAGNMASAIAKGALKKQFIAAENLYFYDIQVEKTAAFAQEIGAHAVASPQEAIAVADLVILAVKPQFVQAALLEAKEAILDKQPLIVSIAAGTTIAELYQLFETTQPLRLVRVMPNMNALIGAGAAAVRVHAPPAAPDPRGQPGAQARGLSRQAEQPVRAGWPNGMSGGREPSSYGSRPLHMRMMQSGRYCL